jgi:hypothetical protein
MTLYSDRWSRQRRAKAAFNVVEADAVCQSVDVKAG